MQYGMNLLLWTDTVNESSFPLFERLKEWGYDAVELPLFGATPRTMAKVARRLDSLRLVRTGVMTVAADENLLSADPQVRRRGILRRKKTLDAAAAAGCRTLVGPLHSAIGLFSGRGPTDDEWKRSVEAMQKIAEYAASVDVMLGIEAINRFECYFLNSAEQLARYVADVNHPYCGAMYDTFHAHIEEKSPRKAISLLADHLVHVHISENDRSTPGSGQVAWKKTFDALQKAEYDGLLVIEAFSGRLEKITDATKIWRSMFDSEEQLARDGLAFMKKEVAKRKKSKK